MPGYGAVYDFDVIRFGGPTVHQEQSVTVTSAGVRVLKNDPDRLAIYMTNNDSGPVYWSTKPTLDPLQAFALGSGIVTIFQVQNDGALCASDIWAFCTTGPFVINILTLRRQSPAR